MRVVAHLRAFYDFVPCPTDVTPTDADVAAGRAKRKSLSDPWQMRVKKPHATHNLTAIPEAEIVRHIIAMSTPAQGFQRLSRKAAVADYVAKINGRAVFFEHSDVIRIEVHDDTGPDEALFREIAAQYLGVKHAGTGRDLLTPEDIDALVALYKEPATEADHVDHLHGRFGVPKGA